MMLSEINLETQSDKGTHHSYIDMYYEKTLANYKDKTITLLEIGVNAGRSLELWARYFNENSKIIGIDKRMNVPYKPSRKNMHYIIGDATKEETVKKFNNIDIIIDDGGHTMNQQITTLKCCFPHLKNDGVFIVEDTHTSYWPQPWGGTFRGAGTFLEHSKRVTDILNQQHFQGTPIAEESLDFWISTTLLIRVLAI